MPTKCAIVRFLLPAVLVMVLPAPARAQADPTQPDPVQPPAAETAQPSTAPAEADSQRFEDFVALIKGPNLPVAARRTGARELLRQNWPQTPARLVDILNGESPQARIAVALALTDLPEFLAESYIDPLMTMLGDADGEVRQAAALALAGYPDNGVIPRLRGIVMDNSQAPSLRLAAVEALGMMSKRPAVAALVEALARDEAAVSSAALAALERATAMSFGGDAGRAQAWWEQTKHGDFPAWQQGQIERLVRQSRELGWQLREMETRLVEAFRAEYIRTPDGERGPLLEAYLKDNATLVRLLGLELVQRQLGEGRPLPAEAAGRIQAQLRVLLNDTEPAVRLAAVQTVARLRDPEDAARFCARLSLERSADVRRALVNGLGYIGDAAVVDALMEIVRAAEDTCRTEAVAALGRLAERRVLAPEQRDAVVQELLAAFKGTTAAETVLRERVLWAMIMVGDARFGGAYLAALAEDEAPLVRQTAVRGIAALEDSPGNDTLVRLTRDADAAVRRTAVQALVERASTDEHLAALWERLAAAQESDQSIRQTAWRGAVRVLSGRSVAEVEQWLGRLPAGDDLQEERTRELLGVLETSLAKVPGALADLGHVWVRIARQRAAADELDAAIAAYCAGLRDLRGGQADACQPVALELLSFSLAQNRYGEPVAALLANGNPPLDAPAMWADLKAQLEELFTQGQAAKVVQMLQALRALPPATWSPEIIADVDELLARAEMALAPAPTSAPDAAPDD
jgi:HEAT repeat protein